MHINLIDVSEPDVAERGIRGEPWCHTRQTVGLPIRREAGELRLVDGKLRDDEVLDLAVLLPLSLGEEAEQTATSDRFATKDFQLGGELTAVGRIETVPI
jgi:hypothetical protein